MTNIGNMYGPNFTFLGIPACDIDKPETYKGADVIIVGAPMIITSAPLYVSGLSRSHAGIPKNVKFGPYMFPMLVMTSFFGG